MVKTGKVLNRMSGTAPAQQGHACLPYMPAMDASVAE